MEKECKYCEEGAWGVVLNSSCPVHKWQGYIRRDRKIVDAAIAFGVDKGWWPLIDALMLSLFAAGWDGEVSQTKEKFGGLRFYIRSHKDEWDGLIAAAEEHSYKVCEKCGKPGKLRGGSWIKTLCDEHAVEAGMEDVLDPPQTWASKLIPDKELDTESGT